MKSQFILKNLSLPQHQFDISQQQTLSCPITPPLSLIDQSTQPLLPAVQFTIPPAPETSEHDEQTTPMLEIPSHDQISVATPASSSHDQTIVSMPELPSHDQVAVPTPESPSDDHTEVMLHEWVEEEKALTKKAGKLRLLIILAVIGLGCAIYFIWYLPSNSSSPAPLPSPASYTNKGNGNSSTTNTAPSSTIEVYVTGAVQHPGVYTLSSDARIYQLLDAAGGPLPNANLVALNLAQKLVDGQEVYVSQIGETPPAIDSTSNGSTNQGQLVNINTASLTDLEQKLRLSSKSAQEIINYRQQHGPFQSIDQLQQVVSLTIYNKIKGMITV